MQLCGEKDRGGGWREDGGRIKGGKAGGADRVEEETSARRAGLALHRRQQKEDRKSLRHSALYPFISLCLSLSTRFHTASGLTLSFLSFATLLETPKINPLSPLSCSGFKYSLITSSLSQSCISLQHLPSALSASQSVFSSLKLFAGKELGVKSVPARSRLCHPTKRVGVKHRHRHCLPKRRHCGETNGCRTTCIHVCCRPLMKPDACSSL